MSLNIAKDSKKRVVIVGGGFGGLKLANKLKKSGFQVVLIDKNNYHQFPPLIYQCLGRYGTDFHFLPFPQDIPASERFLFPYGGSTCCFPRKEHDTDFHREGGIRLSGSCRRYDDQFLR